MWGLEETCKFESFFSRFQRKAAESESVTSKTIDFDVVELEEPYCDNSTSFTMICAIPGGGVTNPGYLRLSSFKSGNCGSSGDSCGKILD